MMALLQKNFEIDAGHRLSHHDYECQNLHGHRYRFEIANVKDPIVDAFDHNFIFNSDDPILAVQDELEKQQEKAFYLINGEPTAENIAEEALQLIEENLSDGERERVSHIRVRLHETPTSSVRTGRSMNHD